MATTTLPRYTCNRCQHPWIPRTDEEPKVCPKCKSPYWNRARTKGVKNGREAQERS